VRSNRKPSLPLASERSLGSLIARAAAVVLRLVLQGISARAQAISGARPAERDR